MELTTRQSSALSSYTQTRQRLHGQMARLARLNRQVAAGDTSEETRRQAGHARSRAAGLYPQAELWGQRLAEFLPLFSVEIKSQVGADKADLDALSAGEGAIVIGAADEEGDELAEDFALIPAVWWSNPLNRQLVNAGYSPFEIDADLRMLRMLKQSGQAPDAFRGYGAVEYGAAAPKRHRITIDAPGARRIVVRQTNNGVTKHVKTIEKASGFFRTHARQGPVQRRADDPARVQVEVTWKESAGGGKTTKSASFSAPGYWKIGAPAAGGGAEAASGGEVADRQGSRSRRKSGARTIRAKRMRIRRLLRKRRVLVGELRGLKRVLKGDRLIYADVRKARQIQKSIRAVNREIARLRGDRARARSIAVRAELPIPAEKPKRIGHLKKNLYEQVIWSRTPGLQPAPAPGMPPVTAPGATQTTMPVVESAAVIATEVKDQTLESAAQLAATTAELEQAAAILEEKVEASQAAEAVAAAAPPGPEQTAAVAEASAEDSEIARLTALVAQLRTQVEAMTASTAQQFQAADAQLMELAQAMGAALGDHDVALQALDVLRHAGELADVEESDFSAAVAEEPIPGEEVIDGDLGADPFASDAFSGAFDLDLFAGVGGRNDVFAGVGNKGDVFGMAFGATKEGNLKAKEGVALAGNIVDSGLGLVGKIIETFGSKKTQVPVEQAPVYIPVGGGEPAGGKSWLPWVIGGGAVAAAGVAAVLIVKGGGQGNMLMSRDREGEFVPRWQAAPGFLDYSEDDAPSHLPSRNRKGQFVAGSRRAAVLGGRGDWRNW